MKINLLYTTTILGAVLSNLVFAQNNDQMIRQAIQMCQTEERALTQSCIRIGESLNTICQRDHNVEVCESAIAIRQVQLQLSEDMQSNPAYAQSADQQRAETACQSGNRQACKELIVRANGYCKRGNREACEYIIRANEVMQSGGNQSTGNGVNICDIYPTRCGRPAQGRTGPVYTPEQLAPGYGSAVRGGLNAMPPYWRDNRYPDSVRNSVRNGDVDRDIERSLRNGVDPYLGAINGRGPGGADYTNEAAKRVLEGTEDPATSARKAMGLQ